MTTIKINLNTMEKIRHFAQNIGSIEGDYDITSLDGHYCIDARSIMGIFSLNLNEKLIFKRTDGKELDKKAATFAEMYTV